MEIFYDYDADGALPSPCSCTIPTYTIPDGKPTFTTQTLQTTTGNNRGTTVTQQGSGTEVTPLSADEYMAAEASLQPEPNTIIS